MGGGIVGLTAAIELDRAGFQVTVVDEGEHIRATWAAAGMLAPGAETQPGETEQWREQSESTLVWPEFLHSVGITPEEAQLTRTGTLLVGWDASDRREVSRQLQIARETGAEPRTVSRATNPDLFRDVAAQIPEGLLFESDSTINPDPVMAGLQRHLQRKGVSILRGSAQLTAGTAVEVSVNDEVFRGDVGVFATGARAIPEPLAGLTTNAVRPIRGSTVRFRGATWTGQPMVRAIVRGKPLYALIRPDGTGLIGATVTEGASPDIELNELAQLLRDANDLLPGLRSTSVVEIRSGLRPAAPTANPFIEALKGTSWYWTSGHFRHGVTLAPLYARRLVGVIQSAS